jgi:nuclear pore complex protein Nup62
MCCSVCTYLCMYVLFCVYISVHVCVVLCVYIYACMCCSVCIYLCMYMLFCVYISMHACAVLCVYICVCMCLVPLEARRGPQIPPELELEMVVSHHVGAGNWTQVLWKSSFALNHWAISSAPWHLFLTKSLKVIQNKSVSNWMGG